MKRLSTFAIVSIAIATLSGCVVAPDRGGDRGYYGDRDHYNDHRNTDGDHHEGTSGDRQDGEHGARD